MKISIIILSYNTEPLTIKCVDSIINNYKNELEKKEIEIIVVDNASSDKSVQSLKNKKYINLIESRENLGFSKGCNLAAKKANGDFLLFLNSDTQVLDKGFLEMAKFLGENNKIGIMGAKFLNPDGTNQKSAGNFYNLINIVFVLLGLERLGFVRKSPKTISKIDWVSGGCMMIKRKFFESLYGFDEKLFMYMEDMEICFRAKKIGFLTYYYSDVKIIHSEHKSSNRTFAVNHIYEGVLYFYKKNKNYFEYLFVKILLIIKAVVAIILGILINNNYLKNTYKSAIKIAI